MEKEEEEEEQNTRRTRMKKQKINQGLDSGLWTMQLAARLEQPNLRSDRISGCSYFILSDILYEPHFLGFKLSPFLRFMLSRF